MPDLLLELRSEEIPARMQARAADDLKKMVTDKMVAAGLVYESAAAFATPRRLTLAVGGFAAATQATREERKGPRTDAPDKALDGFLRSTGLTKDQLVARDDKKGQVWFAVIERPGRPAADVIADAVTETVRTFPWPKSMRWGTGTLRWVRPLRGIVCVVRDEAGSEIVPFEIDGLASSDQTFGHRNHPGAIRVTGFDDYAAGLAAKGVVLDPAERKESIAADARTAAFAQGLELIEDPGLLAEVSGLAEQPVVLMGAIGDDFLDLPAEVLRTSMKEHQKFFSVRNPDTGRIEKFITVANVDADDGGANILAGNAKVLAARLADAKFFWENDLRTVANGGMAALGESLGTVVFHAKLGSQADRITRITALAEEIAPTVGADPALARQAAEVAKADLVSEMVFEFPELQGVMGAYYARAAGLPDPVADACRTHYAPLGPSDDVPTEPVAMAVALADKIDMLTGFWAIDEKPTGSKDPFALRRAALGVIRIILENGVRVRLNTAPGPLSFAADQMGALARGDGTTGSADTADLLAFLADRLKVHLREEGVRHDVIQACFELGGQDDLVLLVTRVRALQAFLGTEDGTNLLAGYRRAANILAAEAKKDGTADYGTADPARAVDAEETALFAALDAAEPAIDAALSVEDFAAAMTAMAGLRAPVDAFFEAVLVNAEDADLRRNRLALLSRISATLNRVAVWDRIEG